MQKKTPQNIPTHSEFDFENIQKARKEDLKKPDSPLNQGSAFNWGPYTPLELLQVCLGFVTLGKTSIENPEAKLGKNTPDHVVGVKKAILPNPKSDKFDDNTEIIFGMVGDVLFSTDSKDILLGPDLENQLKNLDILFMNIESPVISKDIPEGRGSMFRLLIKGLKGNNFCLQIPQSYLQSFFEKIKKVNPAIQIICGIANNHTPDCENIDLKKLSPEERTFYQCDPNNFSIFRTIHTLKQIDKKLNSTGKNEETTNISTQNKTIHITGAWTNDMEFSLPSSIGSWNVYTDPVAVVNIKGIKIGFLATTNILNYNYKHKLSSRVIRSTDIDAAMYERLKKFYQLDYLYLSSHTGLEQNLFASKSCQKLLEDSLSHCDAHISTGSHVPSPFQVKKDSEGNMKPFIHSLGNGFGPTNPRNTAVGTLFTGKIKKESIDYEANPIEATITANGPRIDTANPEHWLTKRWHSLHLFTFDSSNNPKSKKQKIGLTI